MHLLCWGAETPVTLSGILMFRNCGLPVAECIIDFALWFAGSLSSITNPLARAIKKPRLEEASLGLTTSRNSFSLQLERI